jgi:hypothetical protein
MEQRQAVILTTNGLLQGLILFEDPSEIRVIINGKQRSIAKNDIRTVAIT